MNGHPALRSVTAAAFTLLLAAGASPAQGQGAEVFIQQASDASPAEAGVENGGDLDLLRRGEGCFQVGSPAAACALDGISAPDRRGRAVVGLTQVGSGNVATVAQRGSGNVVIARQAGIGNRISTLQQGRDNAIEARLEGDANRLDVRQRGSRNTYLFSYRGDGLDLSFTQIGNGLRAVQRGVGGLPLEVTQTGTNTTVRIEHRPFSVTPAP